VTSVFPFWAAIYKRGVPTISGLAAGVLHLVGNPLIYLMFSSSCTGWFLTWQLAVNNAKDGC
jgi:hypothetical protein